jgi:Flp pilus assembly protein TadD/outer membrane protein OmpA-like peptidoglycan-associated protein
MRKQLFFAVTLVLAMVFSSCNKDLTALDPSLFTTTPNPLVEKAGKVDATITGTFPVKYFAKNATVTVTPVLVFNGTEVKGTPTQFQGEKVKSNNKIINFKAGGKYTIQTTFNYVPAMAKSELYLDFSVSTSKKTYTIPRVKVADGVMATAQLVAKSFGAADGANGPIIIADKFQRVIQEMQEADIKFLIQKSDIQKKEMKSEDIVALTQKIKAVKESMNQQVAGFEIAGYASPDGSMEINTNLAEKRQKVTADFINKELKKVKTSVTIDSKFTAEDWDGFQKLMESSSIQDKQVILSVLSMYTDPEQREREIKNLSNVFKSIAEQILPELRRSRLKLTVDVTGKSDVEIAKLAKEDASKLSLEELLYAATLTQDLSEKAAIYTKATEKAPDCLRTYNNLGVVKYQQGNIDEAARLFAKALELKSIPDVNYNAGLCALAKGDLGKAEVSFGKAAGTKGNLSNALGTISIIKGDYTKAKTFFGKTSTNNAAILQILDGNYNGARATLDAVAQPDALTSYLNAIVGARTNNRDAVYAGLRKAVSMDDAYKAKATNDIEFAKFNTEDAFKAIVK